MHLDAKTCTQELEHDVNLHREDLKSESSSLVTYRDSKIGGI